jgi:hypothetical protein
VVLPDVLEAVVLTVSWDVSRWRVDVPSKPKLILQFAGMHLLLYSLANCHPLPGRVESFFFGIEDQGRFAGTCKLEERDFLLFDFGDVVVGVGIADESQSMGLGVDARSIAVRLEVTEDGGAVGLSGG